MTRYLFAAFLAAGFFNFACSILILRRLAVAGFKVNFFEIRWQVHKHLKSYRQVSLKSTGRVGLPYYGYQASLLAALGLALLTLLSLSR